MGRERNVTDKNVYIYLPFPCINKMRVSGKGGMPQGTTKLFATFLIYDSCHRTPEWECSQFRVLKTQQDCQNVSDCLLTISIFTRVSNHNVWKLFPIFVNNVQIYVLGRRRVGAGAMKKSKVTSTTLIRCGLTDYGVRPPNFGLLGSSRSIIETKALNVFVFSMEHSNLINADTKLDKLAQAL